MKKTFLYLISGFFFSLFFFGPVTPALAGFAISPGKIIRENLKPGAETDQQIVVSRSEATDDLLVTVEPELGAMNDWITFEPGTTIDLPAGQKNLTITAKIKIPAEAAYQQYQGLVRIKGGPKQTTGSGVSVVQGARMDVSLVITKEDISSLIIRDLKFNQLVGQQPLELQITAENLGNIPVAPQAEIELLNLQQQSLEVLTADNLDQISPNRTQTITAKFKTNVGSGEYFANVKISLDEKILREDRLIVEVLNKEAGTFSDRAWKKVNLLAQTLITNDWIVPICLGAAFAINAGILVSRIKKQSLKTNKKSSRTKTKKTWPLTKFLGASQLLLLILFLFSLNQKFNWWSLTKDQSHPSQPVSPSPATNEPVVNPTTANPAAAPTDDRVKGAFQIQQISLYEIYAEPNYQAKIIYLAQEGENFVVIEKRSDWYQVKVADDKIGWLPARNVVKED